jgi:glycolate oxidase iron-sulfur subunit
MKEYARLLRDDPRYGRRAAELSAGTRDLSEILVASGTRAPRGRLDVTVAYHDACHLAHAQGIRDAPRALLAEIPGLELREVAEPELCCGSAGVYNLLEIDAARELGMRKAANVAATGADILVAANPGCLMQIRAAAGGEASAMTFSHVAEVLDASLRAASREGTRPVRDRRRWHA